MLALQWLRIIKNNIFFRRLFMKLSKYQICPESDLLVATLILNLQISGDKISLGLLYINARSNYNFLILIVHI
jgi:hypothetical protein